jgi:hypothetical protein
MHVAILSAQFLGQQQDRLVRAIARSMQSKARLLDHRPHFRERRKTVDFWRKRCSGCEVSPGCAADNAPSSSPTTIRLLNRLMARSFSIERRLHH